MSRATSIINKLNRVLVKLDPYDGQVYKRVFTDAPGYNRLTGRGTRTQVDTLITPQPLVSRTDVDARGTLTKTTQVITSDTNRVPATGYTLTFSATAITPEDLSNPALSFVFKSRSGAEELFTIVDFNSTSLIGTDLMYTAYVRSAAR